MKLFCELPSKKELYTVVAVPLTNVQVEQVAAEVMDEGRIFHEDPRKWPSLEAFLGFRIAVAAHDYQISTPEQMGLLIDMVYKWAKRSKIGN